MVLLFSFGVRVLLGMSIYCVRCFVCVCWWRQLVVGVTGGVWRFWGGCARWRVGFEVVLMSDVVDMQIRRICRRLGCAAGELS
jgi:hypothetical protein